MYNQRMAGFCGQGLLFFSTLAMVLAVAFAEFEELVTEEEAAAPPTSETQFIGDDSAPAGGEDDEVEAKENNSQLSPFEVLDKELKRRQSELYPQKELNPPLTTLCKKHPKHQELLSEEQRRFYCQLHSGFRSCYTNDVLFNDKDLSRPQKIKIAKECILATEGMALDFQENPDHVQNLARLENFEKYFLELMLPPVEPKPDPEPNFIEGSTIYEMGTRVRRDKTTYALNNQQENVQELEYVDKAFDKLDAEVLKYKEHPKPVFKQYVDAYEKEIFLLDTIPEETNEQGQKIVYQFRKDHCLSRPQSASQCKKLIEELKRQEEINAINRESESGFDERIIYRNRKTEQ